MHEHQCIKCHFAFDNETKANEDEHECDIFLQLYQNMKKKKVKTSGVQVFTHLGPTLGKTIESLMKFWKETDWNLFGQFGRIIDIIFENGSLISL